MTPKDKTLKDLKAAGYELKKHGAKHDKYFNPKTRATIMVKRHDFTESTRRYILKEIEQNRGKS